MKNKTLKLGAFALAASLATSAYAEKIYINSLVNTGDANSKTALFDELGYTGLLATSVYNDINTNDVVDVGDTIYDTNVNSLLATYYPGGAYTAIDGTTPRSLIEPLDFGQSNLDGLNPLAVLGGDVEGFSTQWGLYIQYELFGTYSGLVNDSKPFDSGYQDIYYTTSGDINDVNNKRILRVDINGSKIEPGNLNLFGTINKASLEAADPTLKNFFSFADDQTFLAALQSGITITEAWDSNVNPPIPTADQLVGFKAGGVYNGPTPVGADYYIRQTTLDGSKVFERVPEPTSITLLGLGLAAMSFRFGRKNQK